MHFQFKIAAFQDLLIREWYVYIFYRTFGVNKPLRCQIRTCVGSVLIKSDNIVESRMKHLHDCDSLKCDCQKRKNKISRTTLNEGFGRMKLLHH